MNYRRKMSDAARSYLGKFPPLDASDEEWAAYVLPGRPNKISRANLHKLVEDKKTQVRETAAYIRWLSNFKRVWPQREANGFFDYSKVTKWVKARLDNVTGWAHEFRKNVKTIQFILQFTQVSRKDNYGDSFCEWKYAGQFIYPEIPDAIRDTVVNKLTIEKRISGNSMLCICGQEIFHCYRITFEGHEELIGRCCYERHIATQIDKKKVLDFEARLRAVIEQLNKETQGLTIEGDSFKDAYDQGGFRVNIVLQKPDGWFSKSGYNEFQQYVKKRRRLESEGVKTEVLCGPCVLPR